MWWKGGGDTVTCINKLKTSASLKVERDSRLSFLLYVTLLLVYIHSKKIYFCAYQNLIENFHCYLFSKAAHFFKRASFIAITTCDLIFAVFLFHFVSIAVRLRK